MTTNKSDLVRVPRELLECFAEKDLCNRTLGELMYWAREAIQRHDADPAEDVRAVVEEPVALGWHTEDFQMDKSATTYDPSVADRWKAKGWPVHALYRRPQRPIVLPERFDIPHRDEYQSADDHAAAVHEANTWNACLDAVEELNK